MPTHFTPNRVLIDGNAAYLMLTNEKGIVVGQAIVDIEDLGRVLAAGRWGLNDRYAKTDGGRVLLHRFVLDTPDGLFVDHWNHNTLDCRKQNLRQCTHTENMQNRQSAHRHSKSGIRNVSWDTRKSRWRVRVYANKRAYNIGMFKTIEEAEQAAIEARQRLHGDFAA